METELSETEIEELLNDPGAWLEKKKQWKRHALEDRQRRYIRETEDIHTEFYYKTTMAETLLNSQGRTLDKTAHIDAPFKNVTAV